MVELLGEALVVLSQLLGKALLARVVAVVL